MSWFFLAISAYFFLAIVSVGDRFLLVGPLPSPKVYAFFIALLGGILMAALLPFGFSIPQTPAVIFLGLTAGFMWIISLVVYFGAIQKSEASRVVPAVGAFVPIFTFFITLFLGAGLLSARELLAFVILIVGGVLIASRKISFRYFFGDRVFVLILLAAFLFAASFLLMKAVFDRAEFINGFIWMRFGGLIAALILLLSSDVRRSVLTERIGFQKQVLAPFLIFQAAGSAGFILQNLAIASAQFSQVPLVNALEGARYLFLFLFVWFLARWRPEILKEEMGGVVLTQKVIAGSLILLGIFILFKTPS